jgi:hypothetical protein
MNTKNHVESMIWKFPEEELNTWMVASNASTVQGRSYKPVSTKGQDRVVSHCLSTSTVLV